MYYLTGEIRIFPFSQVPEGWEPCNGQQLQISRNQALFSLLKNYYGGDGKVYFNLPNLNGTVIVGAGQAKSGTYYQLGNEGAGGSETVQLDINTMPAHTHIMGANKAYNNYFPNGDILADPNTQAAGSAAKNTGTANIYGKAAALVNMPANTVTDTGAGLPHENRQPFLPLVYCIATAGGDYPSRPRD